jgi:tetratricopeptide (TPR) repeat protein
MNLTDERLRELDDPSLTEDERALLRCRVAADLIHRGQYEAARASLGDLWRGIGERPNSEGLAEATAAEVLLQCGALTGRMGASRQAQGAQDAAKDLISESAELFERLGEAEKAALARSDLALCYWRQGEYNEARALLEGAYERGGSGEPKVKIALRLTVVEASAGRHADALRVLTETAPLLEKVTNHALRGNFHNERALILRRLGTAENSPDYFDRAIIEHTAAIFHYEQAGDERYKATNENNLAFLLYKLGRYSETHAHLNRARRVLLRLKDAGLLAQVDETKARVLIAEQKYREANRVIGGAVQTLERGGDSALLADALTVQAVAWARLGLHESSINALRRAVRLAEESGARSNAGLAALTLIEEHGAERMSAADVYGVYTRADELLRDTQDAEDIARLRACARVVMRRLSGPRAGDKDFSLYGAIHDFEARAIGQALEEAGGSVTKAARLLDIPYQTLTGMLRRRHRGLLKKRAPAKRRLRSIVKKK